MIRRTLKFFATLMIAWAVSDLMGWFFFGGPDWPATKHIMLWTAGGSVLTILIFMGWVDMGRKIRVISLISRQMKKGLSPTATPQTEIGERRPYRPTLMV